MFCAAGVHTVPEVPVLCGRSSLAAHRVSLCLHCRCIGGQTEVTLERCLTPQHPDHDGLLYIGKIWMTWLRHTMTGLERSCMHMSSTHPALLRYPYCSSCILYTGGSLVGRAEVRGLCSHSTAILFRNYSCKFPYRLFVRRKLLRLYTCHI